MSRYNSFGVVLSCFGDVELVRPPGIKGTTVKRFLKIQTNGNRNLEFAKIALTAVEEADFPEEPLTNGSKSL